MRIQHNIMAMNSYRNYNNNTSALSGNLEKLSSGYKINRAGDDAAGLAISEKMRAQITGLDAAQKNVKDGISLVKTAEGAMQEIQDMLNRMSYLADQSANGTYDDGIDRANLQKEVNSLMTEINRIADSANFNGINLLDGTQSGGSVTFTQWTSKTNLTTFKVNISANGEKLAGGSIQIGNTSITVKLCDKDHTEVTLDGTTLYVKKTTKASAIATAIASKFAKITVKGVSGDDLELAGVASGAGIKFSADTEEEIKVTSLPMATINSGLQLQIGDTSDTFNQMRVGINEMKTGKLLLDGNVDISTQSGAAKAIDYVKNAINMVSSTRGDLGALQNRLDHTANNLSVMAENIQDAESTIRDTDVADEMMAYTKNNILIQSAQAMLAQANSVPQGVLQLLQ